MKNFSIYLAGINEVNYNNFIINYSKNYKNKISLFNKKDQFLGDFYNIISAKLYINKLNNLLESF